MNNESLIPASHPENTYVLLVTGSSSISDKNAPEIWLAGSLNIPSQKYDDILLITAGPSVINNACREYAIHHHIHLNIIPAAKWHLLQVHTLAMVYPNRNALFFWDGKDDEMVQNFYLSCLCKTPSYTVHIGYDKTPSDDLDEYLRIDPRRLIRIKHEMPAKYPDPDDALLTETAERILWIGSDKGRETDLNMIDTRYVDLSLKNLIKNEVSEHSKTMYNIYLQAFNKTVEAENAGESI